MKRFLATIVLVLATAPTAWGADEFGAAQRLAVLQEHFAANRAQSYALDSAAQAMQRESAALSEVQRLQALLEEALKKECKPAESKTEESKPAEAAK